MGKGEFKVEIPISINGSKATGSSSQKGSKYEQEIVKQQISAEQGPFCQNQNLFE